MARNSLLCADVPLRNYSLTQRTYFCLAADYLPEPIQRRDRVHCL